MVVEVYIDGLSEPTNPGVGTYGYAIYDESGKIVEGRGVAGDLVSNNFAEYSALVAALGELLKRSLRRDIVIKSDSRLLVNQMSGKWRRRKGGYLEKYRDAKELADNFASLTFRWIPREQNGEADQLSRMAYEEYGKAKRLPVKYRQRDPRTPRMTSG